MDDDFALARRYPVGGTRSRAIPLVARPRLARNPTDAKPHGREPHGREPLWRRTPNGAKPTLASEGKGTRAARTSIGHRGFQAGAKRASGRGCDAPHCSVPRHGEAERFRPVRHLGRHTGRRVGPPSDREVGASRSSVLASRFSVLASRFPLFGSLAESAVGPPRAIPATIGGRRAAVVTRPKARLPARCRACGSVRTSSATTPSSAASCRASHGLGRSSGSRA
jgi:hypothetical protein